LIPSDSTFSVKDVKVDGVSKGAVSELALGPVTSDTSITAVFAKNPAITATAGIGGTITPKGVQVVGYAGSKHFEIQALPGYTILKVVAKGITIPVTTGSTQFSTTVTNITAPCTIAATFTLDTSRAFITASSGTGGSVVPSGKVSVPIGDDLGFTVTPTAGYRLSSLKVDGVMVAVSGSYTFYNVTKAHSLAAAFVPLPVITATISGNGSLTPPGKTVVPFGGSQTYTITPVSGYDLTSLLVNGKAQTLATSYTFTNVTANQAIATTFKLRSDHVIISASAGAGGSISPSGPQTVAKGSAPMFTVAPNTDYRVLDVKVDGKSVGAVTSYTFSNVQKNAVIAATFTKLPVITAKQSVGGIIDPPGGLPIAYNGSRTYSVTPATGYDLVSLVINGKTKPAAGIFVFSNVIANQSIGAVFKLRTDYVLITAATLVGGSITPAGVTPMPKGGSQTYQITPKPGYKIVNLLVNGKAVAAASSHTFTNLTASQTISATFGPADYLVTTSSPSGGTITPTGQTTVSGGKDLVIKITPPVGFKAGIKIDGTLLGQDPTGKPFTYTLRKVAANHSVQAVYARIGSQFAGTLSIGLVGLGDSILVTNQNPATFQITALGTLGIKALHAYNSRFRRWFPVTLDGRGGSASVAMETGDNALWFAAVANDNSVAWYPSTVTYYPNLDLTTPLTPSVDTVSPAQTTTIRWTLGLLHAANATVTLYSVAQDGSLSQAAAMQDDGVLPDEIQGDGVFSTQISVAPATEGYLDYRATVVKTGETPYQSEQVSIWSSSSLTSPQVTNAVDVADAAKANYDQQLAAGKTANEAAALVLAQLQADPNVGAAGTTEEGGLWWVTNDGILGCYAQQGSGSVKTAAANSSPRTQAQSRPITDVTPRNSGTPNYYAKADWNQLFQPQPTPPAPLMVPSLNGTVSTTQSLGSTANRIKSKQAVIMSPHYAQFGAGDDYHKPWPTIQNNTDCGLYAAAEHLDQGGQYVSIAEGFGDFGYIHISSHGDNFYNGLISWWKDEWGPNGWLTGSLSQVGLWSGATLPQNTDGTWAAGAFDADLKAKRVAVAPDGEVFLLPGFFTYHLPKLPNSLVILSACRSGYNSSLAKVFLAKGAGAVVAYTDYVKTSYAQDTLQEIVDQMYADRTLSEAVGSAIAAHTANDGPEDDNKPPDGIPDPAELKYFGSSDLKFPDASLRNAGFEEGALTPWVQTGDGRVIAALGATRPTEGNFMGVISTGLGYTASSGSIEQRMCVSATGGELTLDWNFFSEEWLEYVGTQFQDTFAIDIAEVDTSTGTVGSYTTVFARTIDDLQGAVTPSDVGFDRGGVYNTGWNKLMLDLDSRAGKTIMVRFSAQDVGDSVYDSAILLDNMQFVPRSPP